MKKKKIAGGFICLILICTGIYYFVAVNNNEFVLKAEVEAEIASYVAEVSGRIVESPVELGQKVEAGDTLMTIDQTNQKYALEQMELTLQKKQLLLEELQGGADSQEIKKARNQVEIAQKSYDSTLSSYQKTLDDFQSIQSLYEEGAVSKQSYEQTKVLMETSQNAADTAKIQVDSANQTLSLLVAGASQETLQSTVLDIAQIESQIQQAKESLEKHTIEASVSGTVVSKNYKTGDMVSAGYTLFEITSDENMYAIAYLPSEKVSMVDYGQSVIVKNQKQKESGEISFIDITFQYTPKDMQTTANKNKDSTKMKVKLQKDTVFRPGQIVEVLVSEQKNAD